MSLEDRLRAARDEARTAATHAKAREDEYSSAGDEERASAKEHWDKAMDDFDAKAAEVRSLESDMKRAREADEKREALDSVLDKYGDPGRNSGDGTPHDYSPDELRAVDSLRFRNMLTLAGRAVAQGGGTKVLKFGAGLHEMPEVRNRPEVKIGDEPIEVRALGVTNANGSTAVGPETVGSTFIGELIRDIEDLSAYRSFCRVIRTPRGQSFTQPRHTGHVTYAWLAEREQFGLSDMAFATFTVDAHKFGGMHQFTAELIQDEILSPDMESLLRQDAARGIAETENAAFATGDGTGKPEGAVPNAVVGVTAASATAITPDELMDLQYTVPRVIRPRCVYMMSDLTENYVRKLKDADNNYIWQNRLAGDNDDTIHGRRYVVDPNIPDIAASARSVQFADLSEAYLIRDVLDMEIAVSMEYGFDTDQITYRVKKRVDGKIRQPLGIRTLVQAAV